MDLEQTRKAADTVGWWTTDEGFEEYEGRTTAGAADPDGPRQLSVWTWEGKYMPYDQRPEAAPLCDVSLVNAEQGWLERSLWVLGIPAVAEVPGLLEQHDDLMEDPSSDGPRGYVLDLETGEVLTAVEALALLGNPALTKGEAARRRLAEHLDNVRYLEAAAWRVKEVRVRLDGNPDEIIAEGATGEGAIVLSLIPNHGRWTIRAGGLGAELVKEWDPRYVLFVEYAAELLREERQLGHHSISGEATAADE